MKKILAGVAVLSAMALSTVSAYADNCAYMQGSHVINNCSYTIIGSYKGDDGSWGGFGPLAPGRQEYTSKHRDAGWNMNWCNYSAWAKGKCRVKQPSEM